MQPEISIIYPVYNVEAFIEKSLTSCLHQVSEVSYEIIIVNDGTKDRSMEIARRLTANLPFVRIIDQQNQGLSMARNNGIAVAEGKYVWCVDSDDLISSDAVEKILGTIHAPKEDLDVIAVGAQQNRNGVYQDRTPNLMNFSDKIICGEDFLPSVISLCAPFYVFRRQFLTENQLSFYPGIFFEDSDFTPRALVCATTMAVLKSPVYTVQINDTSITRSKITEKKCLDHLFVAQRLFSLGNMQKNRDVRAAILSLGAVCLNSFLSETFHFPDNREIRMKLLENAKLFHYAYFNKRPIGKIEAVLSYLPPKLFIGIFGFCKRNGIGTKK